MSNVVEQTGARKVLFDAWRAVANAKLKEFRHQCWHLAGQVQRGIVDKQDAIDRLWEIAVAHALVRIMGEDRVEGIIAEAFECIGSVPKYTYEAAA
jgi:hypothetical protein